MKNRSKYIMATTIALLLIVVVTVVTNQADKTRLIAKSVCDYSHQVESSKWEDACQSLQEATNTRYQCEELSSDARCWLQEK